MQAYYNSRHNFEQNLQSTGVKLSEADGPTAIFTTKNKKTTKTKIRV